MTSRFVVIEGPNGVGKSTVSRLLAERWAQTDGQTVHLTTEPSRATLGRVIRAAEADLSGRALALAIAADRYDHIEREISPALSAGGLVVSDRYVQSSLVLQRIDGLDLEEVWQYNRYVLKPDASLYLVEDERVIARRLAARIGLSRLEATGSPGRELQLYAEAIAFLDQYGWPQYVIDCKERAPDDIVAEVISIID